MVTFHLSDFFRLKIPVVILRREEWEKIWSRFKKKYPFGKNGQRMLPIFTLLGAARRNLSSLMAYTINVFTSVNTLPHFPLSLLTVCSFSFYWWYYKCMNWRDFLGQVTVSVYFSQEHHISFLLKLVRCLSLAHLSIRRLLQTLDCRAYKLPSLFLNNLFFWFSIYTYLFYIRIVLQFK